MKKNELVCFVAAIILGATVLVGCSGGSDSSNSTPKSTNDITAAPTVEKEASVTEMTVKLEKFKISEETASKFVEKAKGEFTRGDEIDLSEIELSSDEQAGFESLVQLVFDTTGTYDSSSKKVSIEETVKAELSMVSGGIKMKIVSK